MAVQISIVRFRLIATSPFSRSGSVSARSFSCRSRSAFSSARAGKAKLINAATIGSQARTRT
jgi:hypothetical protein